MHWEHIKYSDPNITEIEWLPQHTKRNGSVILDYTTSRLNNNYCFYMNPYIETDPEKNMTIAFHDLIYKASVIEDKFLPEKPTVRNRLIFHSFCCINDRPVTAELLYNGICERVGHDLHPNDIIYFHFTGECYMDPITYRVVKTFLKLCDETKVVFMTGSIGGVITSRTTKNLFSDNPNFYMLCTNDWICSTQGITSYDPSYDIVQYQEHYPKSKTFIALMGGPRSHRAVTIGKLAVDGLLDNGYVSWNVPEYGYNINFDSLQIKSISPEFDHPDYEILATKVNSMDLPGYKNMIPFTEKLMTRPLNPFYLNEAELTCHQDAYVYLVPETQYWNSNPDLLDYCVKPILDRHEKFGHYNIYSLPSNFYSEKVWKPMTNKIPFIVVGTPYNLQSLRDLGFKTFHPWIDETYDTIEDDYLRLDAISKELQRLRDNPPDKEWMDAVKEIGNHNYSMLFEWNGHGPNTLLNNRGEVLKTDFI